MGMDVRDRPLETPSGWDRFFNVRTDLDPLLGTPGLAPAGFKETVETPTGPFVQRAESGFFLVADEPVAGDPIEVGAAISGLYGDAARAPASGMRRRRVRSTRTGTHVVMEQLVRGARMVGADCRVHQGAQGVYAITGRPIADAAERDPGPAPELAPQDAIEACLDRFDLDGDALEALQVDAVVFPDGDGATWAYEVGFVVPQESADVRAYLRADTLDLLVSYNIASCATAQVHDVNPLQTPDLIQVQLQGLDGDGTILRGQALDVHPRMGTRVERSNGTFVVDPGEPAFDEVQVYHHLWRGLQWFRARVDPQLLAAPPFAPMTVFVNDPGSPDNAFYKPSTGALHFGLFDGARSSARSISVAVHELGHAVTDAICRLGRTFVPNSPARGLSEGFSDYFAASLLDDPRLGDFVADDPEGLRNCTHRLRFPDGFVGREHSTGAAWATVLWGLRERVGATASDPLVIESLDFLGPSATFLDAKAALLEVDRQLFGGGNAAAIEEEFAARAPAT